MFIDVRLVNRRTPAGCYVEIESKLYRTLRHSTPLGCGLATCRHYKYRTPSGVVPLRGVTSNRELNLLRLLR